MKIKITYDVKKFQFKRLNDSEEWVEFSSSSKLHRFRNGTISEKGADILATISAEEKENIEKSTIDFYGKKEDYESLNALNAKNDFRLIVEYKGAAENASKKEAGVKPEDKKNVKKTESKIESDGKNRDKHIELLELNLERQFVLYDIDNEKDSKNKKLKFEWLESWEKTIEKQLENNKTKIEWINEKDLINEISENLATENAYQSCVMALMFFESLINFSPYHFLENDSSMDEKEFENAYANVKLAATNVEFLSGFADELPLFDDEFSLNSLSEAYKSNLKSFKNRSRKIIFRLPSKPSDILGWVASAVGVGLLILPGFNIIGGALLAGGSMKNLFSNLDSDAVREYVCSLSAYNKTAIANICLGRFKQIKMAENILKSFNKIAEEAIIEIKNKHPKDDDEKEMYEKLKKILKECPEEFQSEIAFAKKKS